MVTDVGELGSWQGSSRSCSSNRVTGYLYAQATKGLSVPGNAREEEYMKRTAFRLAVIMAIAIEAIEGSELSSAQPAGLGDTIIATGADLGCRGPSV